MSDCMIEICSTHTITFGYQNLLSSQFTFKLHLAWNIFGWTITQLFYIALSHINIRTRNKISAGVLIIRAGGLPKKISKKSHSAENEHSLSLYIAEHTRLVPKTEELSAANQNRVSPESSANQNGVLHNPSRQQIRIDCHSAEKHPRALG